jgi:hypothetical protein
VRPVSGGGETTGGFCIGTDPSPLEGFLHPYAGGVSFSEYEELLPWFVLALGGALVVGTVLALVRPKRETPEGELARPPLARSLVMIALGAVAAVWGLATLAS